MQYASCFIDGVHQYGELAPVRKLNGDDVASLDALVFEPCGKTGCGAIHLLIGVFAVIIAYVFLVGIALRLFAPRIGDGIGSPVSHVVIFQLAIFIDVEIGNHSLAPSAWSLLRSKAASADEGGAAVHLQDSEKLLPASLKTLI